MIKLSREECENFKIAKIDFISGEKEERKKNLERILGLKNIYIDTNWNNSDDENTYDENTYKRMENYYSLFINKSKEPDRKSIISSVKKELFDLDKKVRNFSGRFDKSVDEVKKNMKQNDLFAMTFSKDPSKQSFHQHFAASWLKKLPFVEEFKEEPAGGKNASYVENGRVVKKEGQRTGKSIDFSWCYTFGDKKVKFYATHKHTQYGGGAQDNQYKDVKDFLDQASSALNPNVYFLSITDGQYYLDKETNIRFEKPISRLKYLGDYHAGKHYSFATNCDSFAKDVIERIIIWLNKNFDINNADVKKEIEKLNILAKKCSF